MRKCRSRQTGFCPRLSLERAGQGTIERRAASQPDCSRPKGRPFGDHKAHWRFRTIHKRNRRPETHGGAETIQKSLESAARSVENGGGQVPRFSATKGQ